MLNSYSFLMVRHGIGIMAFKKLYELLLRLHPLFKTLTIDKAVRMMDNGQQHCKYKIQVYKQPSRL